MVNANNRESRENNVPDNIDVNNNLCSIKLKSTSDASFLSNYLLKKKYAIKHYSINKGQLDEVFRQLTNTV